MLNDIDDLQEWFHDMEHNITDAETPKVEPDKLRTQLRDHKVNVYEM